MPLDAPGPAAIPMAWAGARGEYQGTDDVDVCPGGAARPRIGGPILGPRHRHKTAAGQPPVTVYDTVPAGSCTVGRQADRRFPCTLGARSNRQVAGSGRLVGEFTAVELCMRRDCAAVWNDPPADPGWMSGRGWVAVGATEDVGVPERRRAVLLRGWGGHRVAGCAATSARRRWPGSRRHRARRSRPPRHSCWWPRRTHSRQGTPRSGRSGWTHGHRLGRCGAAAKTSQRSRRRLKDTSSRRSPRGPFSEGERQQATAVSATPRSDRG
jgi:hypothetical protein